MVLLTERQVTGESVLELRWITLRPGTAALQHRDSKRSHSAVTSQYHKHHIGFGRLDARMVYCCSLLFVINVLFDSFFCLYCPILSRYSISVFILVQLSSLSKTVSAAAFRFWTASSFEVSNGNIMWNFLFVKMGFRKSLSFGKSRHQYQAKTVLFKDHRKCRWFVTLGIRMCKTEIYQTKLSKWDF